MGSFSVIDATGSGSGWNVTVNGDATGGKSAVFKQYCSNGASACGADSANSYVGNGATLAANSPVRAVCPNATCGTDAGPGYVSGGATSLTLSAPTTTRSFSQPGEVYRADLLWTLSSGP